MGSPTVAVRRRGRCSPDRDAPRRRSARSPSAQNAHSSRTASAIIVATISEIVSAIKTHTFGSTVRARCEHAQLTSCFVPAAVDNWTLPTAAKESATRAHHSFPSCSCEPGAPLAVDHRLTALRPNRNGDEAPSPPSSSTSSRITGAAFRLRSGARTAARPPSNSSDGSAPRDTGRHLRGTPALRRPGEVGIG